MSKSQIALNSKLDNYFVQLDANRIGNQGLESFFEDSKVIIIDGIEIDTLEFFMNLPKSIFSEWIPPVFQKEVQEDVSKHHRLWRFYPDDSVIESFQKESSKVVQQMEDFIRSKMSSYEFSSISCSWRMNAMDKGFLHFDIPEDGYEDHQVRYFLNLSRRPRIIEFGPTLESFIEAHKNHPEMKNWLSLSHHEFHSRLKYDLIKPNGYEDSILPRHYLTLAPGSMWISNAFSVLHGLVFGEKTVCFEAKIKPESLLNPKVSSFSSKMKRLKERYG